jgi:pyridoxamine 5'-phosphate oxidase
MSTLPPQILPDPLPGDPLVVAAHWLAQAWDARHQPNPNAMTLATVGGDGRPSARIVLCKDIVLPDGYLLFVSNYNSRKGAELAHSARASVVMHWDTFHRQVRVEGQVVRSPAQESDAYFSRRPWQSQVGAWASEQSRPVESRQALIEQWRAAAARFGTPPVGPDASTEDAVSTAIVPRPPHWGGYRLWADRVELWVEGEFRIHDRACWRRTLRPGRDPYGFEASPWKAERLQP